MSNPSSSPRNVQQPEVPRKTGYKKNARMTCGYSIRPSSEERPLWAYNEMLDLIIHPTLCSICKRWYSHYIDNILEERDSVILAYEERSKAIPPRWGTMIERLEKERDEAAQELTEMRQKLTEARRELMQARQDRADSKQIHDEKLVGINTHFGQVNNACRHLPPSEPSSSTTPMPHTQGPV